jgi:hypothetical protein
MSPQQNSPCCLLPPLGLINRLVLLLGLMSRLELLLGLVSRLVLLLGLVSRLVLLLGLMSRLVLLLGLVSRLVLLLGLMSRLVLLLAYCGNSSCCRCRCCWLLWLKSTLKAYSFDCSAQTRTGMGRLRKPPGVELIPAVD